MKNAVWGLASVCILGTTLFGCTNQAPQEVKLHQAGNVPQSVVAILAQKGVMRESDYNRLYAIGAHIQAAHTVTDAELDFALNLLRRGPLRNEGGNTAELRIRALSSIGGKRKLTTAQKERLVAAVLPLTQDPPREFQGVENGIPSSEISAQRTAMSLLSTVYHPAVVVQFEELAKNSAIDLVRTDAANCLRRVQAAKKS